MANYINIRYEHNIEQKFWFAWLFANCYYLPTAWILLNEFPDYELADDSRVFRWNNDNYSRLRYETDMKYEKGKLPIKLTSYKKHIGESQHKKFVSLLGDNESDSFDSVWKFVKTNFHGFGRYSTWFYLQQLKHTCQLPIEPKTLFLSDVDGSKAHRKGLLYALGEESKLDTVQTQGDYMSLESKANEILSEMHLRFPDLRYKADRFAMETCLCAFQKLFREKKTRFLGYYHGRQADNIIKVQGDNWTGIDWDVLWEARKESLDPRVLHLRLDSVTENDFLQTGQILLPWERTSSDLSEFF